MLALVNAPFDGNIRYILHRITGAGSNAAFSTEAAERYFRLGIEVFRAGTAVMRLCTYIPVDTVKAD
jgi:hypothetical protein